MFYLLKPLKYSPAFVGNDSLLQQLVLFVCSDRQPVTKLAIIQSVGHFEDLSSAEGEALRSLLVILKVGPDEERVSSTRC